MTKADKEGLISSVNHTKERGYGRRNLVLVDLCPSWDIRGLWNESLEASPVSMGTLWKLDYPIHFNRAPRSPYIWKSS